MKTILWPLLPLLLAAALASAQDTMSEHRAAFTLALREGGFDDALQQARVLLDVRASEPALLDELTYALASGGARQHAARLLLEAYPFAAASAAERDTLLRRLTMLVEHNLRARGDAPPEALRTPLDTPGLRSHQAAFWANLHDCGAVRVMLQDLAPEYGYDDLMRLGDCATPDAPHLAQQAFARAHALRPGERASRALAFQAHAAGDYPTALGAWRLVGADRLDGDALLGAVTTALAAGEPGQAADWLRRYRDRGETLHRRYWSLQAQVHAPTDAAAARAALEQAIRQQPHVEDYLQLSRLEDTPARQVLWLERAAALDADDASVQLELAYALSRGHRPFSALGALERAAALDPENMQVQVDLGYAYWHARDFGGAQRAFERAWHADSGNVLLAQQLVYVHQRLKQNEQARSFVRQVLDAAMPGRGADQRDADLTADRRYAFQRLHEDLGRRVTVTLDGWSGTGVGTGTAASQPGSRHRSYSQLEADVRLGKPPIRDGSTLSAYARVLADGGEGSALPSRNALLGVGMRWKPWRRHVVYVAAEHQNGLETREHRDTLLRVSGSFLNGGRYGDDWRPSGGGWLSRNLYVDVARYLRTEYGALTVDYRTSYHRKVSAKGTVEPYAHLQFSTLRFADIERDIRSGIGLRWNMWHGATRYNADPHKLSVGLELQHAFETYSSDRTGVFLTFSTRW